MADLEWPIDIVRPSSVSWRLVSNTQRFTSKFNQATQTVRFPGSLWRASMTFSKLDDYEARAVESIIVTLDGGAGRIWMGDYGRWGRPEQGTPVVAGVNQTGFSLNTSGWTPNTIVALRGDYFQIGNEMKLLTTDVVSTAAGLAVLNFGPMLRTSPANGTAINLRNPRAKFMLEEDENGPDRAPAFSNDFSLSFVEAYF